MYWLPKTKIGKIFFWMVISGFLTIVLLNAIASIMPTKNICDSKGECYPDPNDWYRNISIVVSLLAMASECIGGIGSIVAVVKYKDRAALLFLPILIGIMGILFLLGEFLFQH